MIKISETDTPVWIIESEKRGTELDVIDIKPISEEDLSQDPSAEVTKRLQVAPIVKENELKTALYKLPENVSESDLQRDTFDPEDLLRDESMDFTSESFSVDTINRPPN